MKFTHNHYVTTQILKLLEIKISNARTSKRIFTEFKTTYSNIRNLLSHYHTKKNIYSS